MAPSSSFERPGLRFSLRALLLIVALLSVWFALGAAWGMNGLLLPLDAWVIGWGLASVEGVQRLLGRAIRKLTLLEFIVLSVMCCLLHGFFLPPLPIARS